MSERKLPATAAFGLLIAAPNRLPRVAVSTRLAWQRPACRPSATHRPRSRLSPRASLDTGPAVDADANASDPTPQLRLRPPGLPELPPEAVLLIAAAAIGGSTGLAVTAYKRSIDALQYFLYGDAVAGPLFGMFGAANLAIIPVIGGLAVAGLRAWNGHPFSGGISDAVADPSARMELSRPLRKAVASVFTLGSGNSLGPEQGSVDIGSVLGQWIAQVLELNPVRQQLLLAAGAASGLAAGFNAPIAGVFFALERLRIGPRIGSGGVDAAVVLLSACISALVAQVGLGATPAFQPPLYDIRDPLVELPMWLILGILCGGSSIAFRSLLRKADEFFNESTVMRAVPGPVMPVIGSCICGLSAHFFPQVLFFGYDTLSSLLSDSGDFSLPILLVLLVVKPLITSICLGSGLVGGTVAPSLFLGAVVGASFEKFSVWVLSVLSHSSFAPLTDGLSIAGAPAYSMIGMAAVLGGILRAPLTSSLLLFELTRDYRIVVPLIAAAGISSAVANYKDDFEVDVDFAGAPYEREGVDKEPGVEERRSMRSLVVEKNGKMVERDDGDVDDDDDDVDGRDSLPPFRAGTAEAAAAAAALVHGRDDVHQDVDKSIELGLPLRTKMDLFLENVRVDQTQLMSRALLLEESVSLSVALRGFLRDDHDVAVVVRRWGDEERKSSTRTRTTRRRRRRRSTADTNMFGEGCELVGLLTLGDAEQALSLGRAWQRVGSVCEKDCVVVVGGTSAQRALDAMQRAGAVQAVVVSAPRRAPEQGAAAEAEVGGEGRPRRSVRGLVTLAGIQRYAGLAMLRQRLDEAGAR